MEREKGMTIVRAISRIVSYCRRYRHSQAFLQISVYAVLAAVFSAPQLAVATIVRMETNVGAFNVELYDAQAPLTVTNFLNYVNRGDYSKTVIHRSVPGFVIQGGGYADVNVFGMDLFFDFPNDPPVLNEFDPSRSNVRGTIAMAKLPGDPNSATSEWFINLADNGGSPNNLDSANGGYTVFGRVLDSGMDIVDAIANLPIQPRNVSMTDGSVKFFGELPVTNNGNLILVNQICINNDGDGACPATEDLAPGGDGNADGIPDRDQPNVMTTQSVFSRVVTFATDTGAKFEVAGSLSFNTSASLLAKFSPPSGRSAQFNDGIYNLKMIGAMGAGRLATLFNGFATTPNHYYAYGPTPDNAIPHWYDFTFDGTTGAEIVGNKILLHFVDGQRGDDDLTMNNSITHTGAPVQETVITTSYSSSSNSYGCSISARPSQSAGNGDWVLVSLFLAFVALVRRRTRR